METIRVAAHAGRVILFHHRPDRADDELDRLAARFRGSPVPARVAVEGTVLDL